MVSNGWLIARPAVRSSLPLIWRLGEEPGGWKEIWQYGKAVKEAGH